MVAEALLQRSTHAVRALEACDSSPPAILSKDGEASVASRAVSLSESENRSSESENTRDDSNESEDDSTASSDKSFDPLMAFDDKHAVRDRNQLVTSLLKVSRVHACNRQRAIFRLPRAVLVASVKASSLNQIKTPNGHRLFGDKARKRAKQDFAAALNGSLLHPPPITQQRIGDYSLRYALTCMLS
jgi:hypothetical protein